MSAFVSLIAINLMKLDSEDVVRARREYLGQKPVVDGPVPRSGDRQVVLRFGR